MNLLNDDELKKLELYSKKPDGKIISQNNIFINDVSLDVSVIVPCFNVSKYISKCIDSLLKQKTNINYEIILINDGSTDNTLDIINKYNDKKIIVINQRNKGMSGARNIGIINSRGKYLVFVDSDDYISENYLDELFKKAFNTGADIVGSEYKTFDSNDKNIKKRIKFRNENDIKKMNGCFWGKIFIRDLFKNIYEPEGYWYEDTIVRHILFPKAKKIKVIDSCYYFYRHNNNGIIRSSTKKIRKIETIYITDLVIKSLDKYFDDNYIKSQKCFENIIEQFYLNESRVDDLDDEIKLLTFNCQSSFIQKYYSNYKIKNNFKKRKYYKYLLTDNYDKSRFIIKHYKLYQLAKKFHK